MKSKAQLRAEIKQGLEDFVKKGKRVKDCPVQAAKNSKIQGQAGHKYLKELKANEQKRRIRND